MGRTINFPRRYKEQIRNGRKVVPILYSNNKDAIRGVEQILMDLLKPSANKIRAVAKSNKNYDRYLEDAIMALKDAFKK